MNPDLNRIDLRKVYKEREQLLDILSLVADKNNGLCYDEEKAAKLKETLLYLDAILAKYKDDKDQTPVKRMTSTKDQLATLLANNHAADPHYLTTVLLEAFERIEQLEVKLSQLLYEERYL